MKALSKSLILMLATAMVLFSCKPESVNPNSSASNNDTPTLAGAAGDVHPNLDPECSNRVPFVLAKAGGGMDVDWSEFGTPPPGTPWGSGEMFNGMDENGIEQLAINFTAAFSWSILSCDYLLDEPSNIQIDQNTGLPMLTSVNAWNNKQLTAGGVNAWQLRYDLTNAPACYNVAVRLTIGKLDFFNGINQNSITEIWIFDPNWAAAQSAGNAETASAYLTNWCTAPCGSPAVCSMDFTTYNQCDYGLCGAAGPAIGLRDQLFTTAFPNGLTAGCATGNTLTLTSAAAVDAFLPSKGGQTLNNNKTDINGRVANPNNNLCTGYSVAECVDVDFGQSAGSCPSPNATGFQRGDFVTTQLYAEHGITISGNSNHSGRTGDVIIFDTENPSGGDWDLGTPNQAYNGPGRGSGGTNPNGRNDRALGNAIILAERITDNNGDGRVDNPDDDAAGGWINIAFENPVSLTKLHLLDLDDNNNNDIILTFADGSTDQFDCPQLGDNSAKEIDVAAALGRSTDGVVNLRVTFSGSGAIAGFSFCQNSGAALDTDACVNLSSGMKSTLGGRLVAAKLNVAFDLADENLGAANFPFGDLVVRPANNPFAGMTVTQVIQEADNFFGQCGSTFTKGQLNGALKKINDSFRNGVKSNNFLKCPDA